MSERLTLQDLVDLLSDKQSTTKKDAENFIRELLVLVGETIEQKDFVRIKDFGTFKLTAVKARRSVDVNTGDPIEIAAHYKLSFTPDKILREGVNRPFSHFESILLDDEVTFEDKEKKEVPKSTAEVKDEPKPKVEVAKEDVKFVELPKVVGPKVEEPKVEKEPEVEPIKEEVIVEATVVETVEPKEELKEEIKVIESLVEEEVKVEQPKVEETIQPQEKQAELEKEKLAEVDLKREEELADLSAFITKEKKVVEPTPPSSKPNESVKQAETVRPVATRNIGAQELEDDYADYEQLAKQRKKRNLWIGVAMVLLLFVGAGYWVYSTYYMETAKTMPVAQNNPSIIISDKDDSTTTKPIASEEPKVIETQEEVKPDPVQAPEAEQPKQQVTQGGKEIEVKSKQTMRLLGQEYYGHGAFWVYIFEENRDRIERPDAIYAGMKLIIAPASKYDIDANDKNSVRKAERQELKLFGEFSDN